jgi:hypothetical protein
MIHLLISKVRPINGVMIKLRQDILIQISAARQASNIDMRVAMLQTLNRSLPVGIRLTLPSMFTDALVRRALETIEDKVMSSI